MHLYTRQPFAHRFARIAGALLLLLAAASPLRAQGWTFWNPADRSLPFSTAINPAIVSFHDTQVSIGSKFHHFGFIEDNSFGLREHHINFSAPFVLPAGLAFGFDFQYYSAMVYSELAASLLLSSELFDRFSVGVKFGIEQRGFHSGEFVGVDPADPLLNGGLSTIRPNLGLGAYWQPGNLRFGIGVDHLNQANIGKVDANAALPLEVSSAIGYTIGPVTPSLLLHSAGSGMRLGFAITAVRHNVGSVRLGYEQELPFKVEASFSFNRDNHLRYGIDMPREGTRGASAGSHELIYTRILGRAPELAQPEILFSTNELTVLRKTVTRSMPGDLHTAELAASGEVSFEYLAESGFGRPVMMLTAGALSHYETRDIRLDRYRRLRARMLPVLESHPDMKVAIKTDSSTIEDARWIRQLLVSNSAIAEDRVLIVRNRHSGQADFTGFAPGRRTETAMTEELSVPGVTIRLKVPGNTRKTRRWRLEIADVDGQVVKVFDGSGNLPAVLDWDWRSDSGDLVPPGQYTAQLSATTIYDNKRTAQSPSLQITLIRRQVQLKFDHDATQQTRMPAATAPALGERDD